MFSWSEILLIAVVALIFIGPKELPEVLHRLGQLTAKVRRTADEFRRHFEESMREAGYEDLHKNIQELRSLNPSSQLRATFENAINQDCTQRPVSSPATPALPTSQALSPEALEQLSKQAEARVQAAESSQAGENKQEKPGRLHAPADGGPAPAQEAQASVQEATTNHAAPVA